MNSKFKTLIIGGAGFIGSHLIKLLNQQNSRELIVVGGSKEPKYQLPDNVVYRAVDANDVNELEALLDDSDEVIDLAYASVPKTSFDDPIEDIQVNLPLSVNLLQLASKANLKKFLLVSSGGTVYGNTRSLPIRETNPTMPISPYGITKLAIEKYANFYYELSALPVIIVRPSNPYGPNQLGKLSQGFVGAAIHAALNGKPIFVFGESGTVRDYIFIDDLATGIMAALDFGKIGEIYNIGTGIGTNNMQIINTLNSSPMLKNNELMVKFLPERGFDVKSNILSSNKLGDISGWKPKVSLVDGLEKTFLWARETINQ